MIKLLVTIGLILMVFLIGQRTGWEMPMSKPLFAMGVLLIAFANTRRLRIGRLEICNGYLLWNWPVLTWNLRHGKAGPFRWLIVSCFEFVWRNR